MSPERLAQLRQFQIYDLEVVLAVAELGSFRKASQTLQVRQSAVSRRVQKLEDAFGVSLFERHPGGARLTNAGWGFLRQARGIVQDFHGAMDLTFAAGSGADGLLQVGLIASLSRGAVRELAADFILQHPYIDHFVVEGERGELLTMLSHRRIDAVVASGSFSSEYGDSFVLTRERICVALPQAHALASRSSIEWDDVTDAHFIVSEREPGPEIYDHIVRRVTNLGRTAYVTRHNVGREAIMNLVGLGLGLSLVADHWSGVDYPGVVFRPIGDEDERVPLSIVWRPENDNPALRRLVSLARVHAKKAAAGDAASRTPDPSP